MWAFLEVLMVTPLVPLSGVIVPSFTTWFNLDSLKSAVPPLYFNERALILLSVPEASSVIFSPFAALVKFAAETSSEAFTAVPSSNLVAVSTVAPSLQLSALVRAMRWKLPTSSAFTPVVAKNKVLPVDFVASPTPPYKPFTVIALKIFTEL